MAYTRPIHLDLLFENLNQEPVHLLRTDHYTRVQLIYAFFPDLPVDSAQESRKNGRVQNLLKELPADARRFCGVCAYVDETFKNYLYYFFTAQRDKSAFCRNLFTELLRGGSDAISFMTEKCVKALKAAALYVPGIEDARVKALVFVLENAMDELSSHLPELCLPTESFRRDIRESLPSGLAKVIASYAVYADVSAFKNDHKRTEMLEQLMELLCTIWQIKPQDAVWQSNIAQGIQAFHAGDFQKAHTLFEEAQRLLEEEDRRSNYATASYADLLSYQAHMLLDGSGGERSAAKAYQLIQTACRVSAPDGNAVSAPRRFYESACYQLFHPEEWEQYSGKKPGMDFLPLLERASEGCIDALVLLADLYLTGGHGCETIKNPAKGITLLEAGAARTDISAQERSKCELRLAQHYFNSPDSLQADQYYEKAARLGNYQAIVHLREKHFHPELPVAVRIPKRAHGRICFFSTLPGTEDANQALRSSLSSDWAQQSGNIPALLRENPEWLQCEQLVFAFLSDDEHQNLTGVLETLKLLNSVAFHQEESTRFALTDRVDLFALVRDEAGRMMIDAAMSHLPKDVYFRVHLCDPDLMAANDLLQRCPTFLPCVDEEGHVREERWKHQKKTERCQRRIALIGTSRSAFAIARQIIACTYLEAYPTQLSIIGPDARHMERLFREECPGLFAGELAPHITPQFYSCDPELLPLAHAGEGEDAQLHEILHQANYFVVAGEDDMRNVSLGIRLRTGLIRARLPHGTQPVIAVLYRDVSTEWLASQISVGARGAAGRYHWTENYGLFLFGSSGMFHYDRLLRNPLEQCALAVHKSYYHLASDQEKERAALRDYYRRSYNRDSSRCLALGIIYHCFGMGVYHARAEDYANPRAAAALGERYRAMGHTVQTEQAAMIEHARWSGWCLSRGWTKPSDDVLTAYMQMQNPRHYLEIGKLHPYLTGYQQLISERRKINELIAAYQHTRRELPDPHISDRELTQKIPDFLSLYAKG